MPSHKQAFLLAFCLLLSIPISAQTSAQPTKIAPEKWPSRPVRMIVPFAPGGLDVIARKVAIKLGEQLSSHSYQILAQWTLASHCNWQNGACFSHASIRL